MGGGARGRLISRCHWHIEHCCPQPLCPTQAPNNQSATQPKHTMLSRRWKDRLLAPRSDCEAARSTSNKLPVGVG